eukprot:4258426-Amphidinium_carterae.1
MEKLGETIEQWEKEVRDYEKVYKKTLDEEIKIGALAPDKVSEHLFLFAEKLQSYADARKVVFEFLDAQVAAQRAQQAAGVVPLDIDGLGKGGKGKDGKG